MGIFARMLGREQRASARSNDPFIAEYFAGRGADAGGIVSPHHAENLSVVAASVQIISETVGMLPLSVYRKLDGGARLEEANHPVAKIFGGDANQHQTASEFIELMTAHTLLRGVSYAEIIRDGRGAPVGLQPIHPDYVSAVRIPATGRIVYDVSLPTGGTKRLLGDEMFRLVDRTDDGLTPKSRLARARDAFGTAMATEQFANATFRNGASLSGVLSHPGHLSQEAADRLRASFDQTYRGPDAAGKTAILEEAMTWTQVSASPDDAQALQSRAFNVQSLCRIFRIPPPIIGDYAGGNYASIVEIHRIFYSHCIQPWLNRWERQIERALLSEAGRRNYHCEFDTDLLVRSDYLQRLQGYRIGREVGLYSANDLRRFESLNARTDPGGDEYLSPMNMQQEQTGKPKDIVIA